MIFLGSVILLVHLLGPFVASEYTAVVEISSGPVRGVIEELPGSGKNPFANKKYAAFRGIRYAQAPLGRLRFKPAEPAEPWNELYTADVEAKECPQYDSTTGNVIGEEDCLFLNVLTPVTNLDRKPQELKSVMVWIHDGNFVSGSSRTDLTNPRLLLEKDIVFVSMNYRLGALGFLSLDHSDATGNQGLKDQNIALKWVQTNIKHFGGDPGKVTIFGKGAGAASVGFHVLSKASEGLFHRAISMSGTPLSPVSFLPRETAVARGKKLGRLIKPALITWKTMRLLPHGPVVAKKLAILKVLYKQPFQRLVEKAQRIDKIAPFMPTDEDPDKATDLFLSERPIVIYESGEFNKVPHILGTTQWDIYPYPALIKEVASIINSGLSSLPNLGSGIGRMYINENLILRAENMGLRIHFRDDRTEEFSLKKNDFLLSHPVTETRLILKKNNNGHEVYYYRMDFPVVAYSPIVEDETHFHLQDSAYTQDSDCIFGGSENYGLSPDDPIHLAMGNVLTMWTNFAKQGNPTPAEIDQNPEHFVWPDFKTNGEALRIGDERVIAPEKLPEKIATLEALDKSYYLFLYL